MTYRRVDPFVRIIGVAAAVAIETANAVAANDIKNVNIVRAIASATADRTGTAVAKNYLTNVNVVRAIGLGWLSEPGRRSPRTTSTA